MRIIYDHYSNAITILRALDKTSLSFYLLQDWKDRLLNQAKKDLNEKEFNKIKIELYWGNNEPLTMERLIYEINKME